ncbi:flagellar hook-length control protein FliK [Pseudalkalibacillus caeni]|uniref:Flagellar hook-length control protein-like C-terminal domain-containing protein n=1 Tax=Exobacillus caeni TaxID=2574798 RepID=A0A5R9FAI5_9BACL|nr:flagellar hook-length control protein FliK [Pseudalkalibacillus caeni]TLS36635.1 hypothetical protein FCL54_14025 [Pseudalkalibacillus caeni]
MNIGQLMGQLKQSAAINQSETSSVGKAMDEKGFKGLLSDLITGKEGQPKTLNGIKDLLKELKQMLEEVLNSSEQTEDKSAIVEQVEELLAMPVFALNPEVKSLDSKVTIQLNNKQADSIANELSKLETFINERLKSQSQSQSQTSIDPKEKTHLKELLSRVEELLKNEKLVSRSKNPVDHQELKQPRPIEASIVMQGINGKNKPTEKQNVESKNPANTTETGTQNTKADSSGHNSTNLSKTFETKIEFVTEKPIKNNDFQHGNPQKSDTVQGALNSNTGTALDPLGLAGDSKTFETQQAKGEQSVPTGRLSTLVDDLKEVIQGRIKVSANSETSQIRMKLMPENLGHIDIKIATHEGKITAQLMAGTHIAKEALELQVNQLRTALVNQGINVDRIDVTQQNQSNQSMFNQQHGQGQQQFGQQQQQKQPNYKPNGYAVEESQPQPNSPNGDTQINYAV